MYKAEMLGERAIFLPAGNELGLKKGDAVRVSAGDWEQVALVRVNTNPNVAPADRNNIQSSKWDGQDGRAGSYRKISAVSYKWDVLRSSKRAWVGLLLMAVGLALAYGNAGLQKDGTFDGHLGTVKWILFGGTVVAALATWLRDTWL